MKQWIEIGEINQPDSIYFNSMKDEEVIIRNQEEKEIKESQPFISPKFYQNLMRDYKEKQAAILPVFEKDDQISKQYIPIKLHIEIKGKKLWVNDRIEQRPDEITVFLLANEAVINQVIVTKKTNWQFSFTPVALYDEKGNKIHYTLKEKSVPGYKTCYEGFVIKNIAIKGRQ